MPLNGETLEWDGELFVSADGITFEPLGEISEVKLDPVEAEPDTGILQSMDLGGEMTFECECPHILMIALLWACLSLQIPNNWLKMHGLPMRRKEKQRRSKCTMRSTNIAFTNTRHHRTKCTSE